MTRSFFYKYSLCSLHFIPSIKSVICRNVYYPSSILLYALQWASEPVTVPSVPIQSGGGFGTAPAPTEDWSATDTGDWASTPAPAASAAGSTAPTTQWGGSSENWN